MYIWNLYFISSIALHMRMSRAGIIFRSEPVKSRVLKWLDVLWEGKMGMRRYVCGLLESAIQINPKWIKLFAELQSRWELSTDDQPGGD